MALRRSAGPISTSQQTELMSSTSQTGEILHWVNFSFAKNVRKKTKKHGNSDFTFFSRYFLWEVFQPMYRNWLASTISYTGNPNLTHVNVFQGSSHDPYCSSETNRIQSTVSNVPRVFKKIFVYLPSRYSMDTSCILTLRPSSYPRILSLVLPLDGFTWAALATVSVVTITFFYGASLSMFEGANELGFSRVCA